MEKRTIGGKPISEVFEKLREDIPNVIRYTTDAEANPYLESNAMRAHFEKCVPIQNYEFTVTEPKFVEFGNRGCFICTGSITIYDDEGNKVVTKSYIGSENCFKLKTSGEVKDLAMDAKNAVVAARKECIRLFGCGERQLALAKEDRERRKEEEKNRGKYGNRNPRQGASSSATATSNAQKAQPQSTKTNTGMAPSAQSSLPQRSNANPGVQTNQPQTGKPAATRPPMGNGSFLLVYDEREKMHENSSMVVISVICLEYKNYRTKLLIWKNRRKKEDLDNLVNRICSGGQFECTGKFEQYGDQYRIVFDKMVG